MTATNGGQVIPLPQFLEQQLPELSKLLPASFSPEKFMRKFSPRRGSRRASRCATGARSCWPSRTARPSALSLSEVCKVRTSFRSTAKVRTRPRPF